MIFGTIEDGANKSSRALTIFQKRLSDIVKDYKDAESGSFGEKKVLSAFSGVFGYDKSDLNAIKKYNSLIEKGTEKTKAFEVAMSGASEGARNLVKNSKSAVIDINTLSASERVATVATQALGIALNTALTLGVSLLIQGIITYINKLINAEKEAAQKAEEMRRNAVDVAEAHKSELESLSDLASQYTKIALSTSNLSDKKAELLKIQEKLNEGISSEKEQVDLLNGSLSENIEKINQRNLAEAKNTVRDLGGEYQEAIDFLNQDKIEFKDKKDLSYTSAINRVTAILGSNNVQKSYDKLGALQGFVIESGEGIEKNIELMDELLNQYDDYLAGTHNTDIYDFYKREYDAIKKIADAYREQYEQSKLIKGDFEVAKHTISEITDDTTIQNNLRKIYDEVEKLSSVLNGEGGAFQKTDAAKRLSELEKEAYKLAGTNTSLKNNVDLVFSAFESGTSSAIQSVGDLRTAWFEDFSDIQKGALKNIDAMKTALQTTMNGEALTSDSFWQLAELDTDRILDGAKLVDGQFQLTEEQLIRLKDTYIKKQIESLEIKQAQLLVDKQDAEQEERNLTAQLNGWNYAQKNLTNPKYREEYEMLKNNLELARDNSKEYGDSWERNNILLRQYNGSLGNTADLLEAAEKQAKKLQEAADKMSNAFISRIDASLDKLNAEKDALNDEKDVLQKQLDILEQQESELKDIISDYEKVADIVTSEISDQITSIEDSYNKQIEALKAQNDEREEAINLTEKLANLNNAKNNKVVTYTEAGGFQYGASKDAVEKAQQEYDNALLDSQIKQLEKDRDSATKGLEEYAKLWEDATKKATKAEEEELAARILGAEWREKISEQDVEIFDTYSVKYDEYGKSLSKITNTEIANVKKSIEAKDNEIKAKEELIKEWQRYKSNVQTYINELKNSNNSYADSIEGITLSEASSFEERIANFEKFKNQYCALADEISDKQDEISHLEIKTDLMTDGLNEFIEGIGTVSSILAEVIKELGKMPSINSAGDVKYYKAAGYEHYANGGVNSKTGLAWLDGTRNHPELILNNADATKLYNLIHSMPVTAAQLYNSPITNFSSKGVASGGQGTTIQISGNTINLPNVQNPQQFAKELERYLQNTLTESQIIPPRK